MQTIQRQFNLSSAPEKAAIEVVTRLHAKGFEAFLVGGSIRDYLLDLVPTEIDVATSAGPDAVQQIFPKTVAVGKAFGVIIVIQDAVSIEVATFREDRDYVDGRHPSAVSFSDAEHDAKRRDFTINALFYDPIDHVIVDYTGGIQDLDDRIIRAIGDPGDRFREDYLRMLRAVRFAARLDFEIEPATLAAISRNADRITKISVERIFTEINKMLTGPNADRAFVLLDETGLLQHVLPEITALKGVQQPPEFHPEGDVWTHTLLLLRKLESPTPVLAWGALLHDIGKPATFEINKKGRASFPSHAKVGADMAAGILKRLHCSREFIHNVRQLVYYHMAFGDVTLMRKGTLKKMVARETFNAELELHRIDCLSSHGKLGNYDFLRQKIEEFGDEPVLPEPLLTGHDVMAAGIPPGPPIGRILRDLEELQLNEKITTRDEALAWLQNVTR